MSDQHFKVTLWWDTAPIAEQFIATDQLDLAKWSRIEWRLDPNEKWMVQGPQPEENHWLPLYQSTWIHVTVERVDSKGRKLTR